MNLDPIPFKRLAGIRNYSTSYSQLGNDYIFSRITAATKQYMDSSRPIRVSGLVLALLLKGKLSLDINSRSCILEPISLLVLSRNSLITISDADWSEIDAYMLFVSTEFIQDINLDTNVFSFSKMEQNPMPIIDNLTVGELEMLKGYMDLLNRNAEANNDSLCTKNAARSLIQSLIYQLMQIKYDHVNAPMVKTEASQGRRMGYVQEFIQLVQTHHFKERSLNFYADKLFISPKYLSRIIKEGTGVSAAEWIDRFVILEAKNMLRFSNMNIQQVAYALNFNTQSSFGKFFKHITGMSPSEYQKT